MKSPAICTEKQTPTGSEVNLFIPGPVMRVDDQRAKDAARLDWLDKHMVAGGKAGDEMSVCIRFNYIDHKNDSFRSMIDAAMKDEGK